MKMARTILTAAGLLLLCACETVPSGPLRAALTGDPIVDGRNAVAAATPRDKVLYEYRLAATAMRRGDFNTAKEMLDDALATLGGIFGKSHDAARARSYFSEESKKTFVGEPFERVMANYYRGILYWMDGEADNARACFRNGQFEDSDAENKTYSQDYVLLDYLDGVITMKLGGDGSDRIKAAQAEAKIYRPPAVSPAVNVMIFVEFGKGPLKYAMGAYGEQLRFSPGFARAREARITVNGQTVLAPAYDDLTFQATTRGGRVMDHILGNKAVFKATTDTIGNAALISGAALAGSGRRNNDAALGLALFGLAAKIVSSATTPKADTRHWDNLPNFLGFAALQLPAGDQSATIELLDAGHVPIPGSSRTVTLHVKPAPQDTVVFISDQS